MAGGGLQKVAVHGALTQGEHKADEGDSPLLEGLFSF